MIGDVEALQGALCIDVVGGIEPAESLVGELERFVISGGCRDFAEAGGDIGEVDVDRDRILLAGMLGGWGSGFVAGGLIDVLRFGRGVEV